MKLVEEAQKTGSVEYIGFRKDIDQWIEKCHCTILPSHGVRVFLMYCLSHLLQEEYASGQRSMELWSD